MSRTFHRPLYRRALALAAWVGGLFAVLLAGCEPPPPTQPALPADGRIENVIVLVVDTLRADHLGTYGHGRNTSPFVDGLASRGIVFEHAMSTSSFTQESIASLMTGLWPARSGAVGWGAVPPMELDTLAEHFERAGYRTGFFSNTETLANPEYAQGFDIRYVREGDWQLSGGGPELSRRVIEFTREFAEDATSRPFFVYAHYLDPHAPYEPADEYYLRFAGEKLSRPLSLYTNVRRNLRRLLDGGFGPGDPRFEDLVLRYDAEIASIDEAIEQLVRGLEAAGLADSTLLVLTADHGEEFLEHGYIDHAWSLYDEVLHVPLIVYAKGTVPGRVDGGVSLVDLMPSLLEIQGLPAAESQLDGRSLFRRHGSYLVAEPEPGVRVAELMIADRNQMRTVVKGRWKYVATLNHLNRFDRVGLNRKKRPTTDAELWAEPIREELYDLEADPEERKDLAAERQDLIRQFRAFVDSYRNSVGERDRALDLSEEERERLRSLGYM